MFEKVILLPVILIIIYIGLRFTIDSKWGYQWNIKHVNQFAEQVKNVPILGFLARENVRFYKSVGTLYIRLWGIAAIIIGLLNLYAYITQLW